MDEIIDEFKQESLDLVEQLMAILEEAENDFSKVRSLDTYGQIVDRIMGGAHTLALQDPELHTIEAIGKYTELCKSIGYKCSQIVSNENLFFVSVGLLLDGTEQLQEMLEGLTTGRGKSLDDLMTQQFLQRLIWLADQYDDSYRSSLKIDDDQTQGEGEEMLNSQAEIDALIAHFSKG